MLKTFKALYPPVLLLLVTILLSVTVSLIFILGSVIALLDIKARYIEYKRLRTLILEDAYSSRIHKEVVRMQYSWCSRVAAIAACSYDSELMLTQSSYYYKKGYRWWHIFPVGAPRCFFKISFWKKVIGI